MFGKSAAFQIYFDSEDLGMKLWYTPYFKKDTFNNLHITNCVYKDSKLYVNCVVSLNK